MKKERKYTNFKDKNGKKIYVGDFVKFKTKGELGMFSYNPRYKYQVVWHEDIKEFIVVDSGDWDYHNKFSDMSDIEVIK